MSKFDTSAGFSDLSATATTVPADLRIPVSSLDSAYRRLGKPLFDVIFVVLLLPVLVPVVCILAAIVSLDGSAPFYSQKRVGRNGRTFRMWKLRTMTPDAEEHLRLHLLSCPHARSEWDLKQKLTDDPRVTRFGKILRSTSLDELPQLFNVLFGQMSVVGPRPMMEGQELLYPGRSYFLLHPGVTGPWQVSDRNSSSFAARAVFDDNYAQNVSFATDLGIIRQTLGVVIRATGC